MTLSCINENISDRVNNGIKIWLVFMRIFNNKVYLVQMICAIYSQQKIVFIRKCILI